MSPHAGAESSATWHEALRENDRALRSAEAERVRLALIESLEMRISTASAEILALYESVAFRDALLEEQRVALAERDSLLAGYERDRLAADRSRRDQPEPLRLPRRALGRARRMAGATWQRIRR
jgi:hypothetical protein